SERSPKVQPTTLAGAAAERHPKPAIVRPPSLKNTKLQSFNWPGFWPAFAGSGRAGERVGARGQGGPVFSRRGERFCLSLSGARGPKVLRVIARSLARRLAGGSRSLPRRSCRTDKGQ